MKREEVGLAVLNALCGMCLKCTETLEPDVEPCWKAKKAVARIMEVYQAEIDRLEAQKTLLQRETIRMSDRWQAQLQRAEKAEAELAEATEVAQLTTKERDSVMVELAEVKQLAKNLLEFAEHGDYSNGNVEYGVDEGDVMARRALADYREQFARQIREGK